MSQNKLNLIILGVALITVIISTGASMWWPGYNWFARSGAIMVLGAAVAEYNLALLQQEANSDAITIAGLGVPASSNPSKVASRISYAAHVFLVLGTAIWGYGDLLLS